LGFQTIALFHFPQEFYELDGLFRVGKPVLAAREPGVHMAHAAFDQNLPSARHLAPADGDLTQHC
jgi:hypothetical protein